MATLRATTPSTILPGSGTTSTTTTSGTTNQPVDKTKDLVNDLIAGKPILGQLLQATASGDPHAISDLQDKSGYTMTSDGLNAALESTDPGPTFNICTVSGLYKFDEPADMTSKTMTIDPTTGRFFLDDLWVSNTTDAVTGHVLFDLSGLHYDFVFTYKFSDSGVPSAVKFLGTRGPKISDPMNPAVTVSGEQVVVDPDSSVPMYNQSGWLEAGMIFTVFGGAIALLVTVWDKVMKLKEEKLDGPAEEQIREDLKDLSIHAKKVIERTQAASDVVARLSTPDTTFKIENLKDSVEGAIKDAVARELRGKDPTLVDLDNITEAAAGAVKQLLAENYLEIHGPEIIKKVSRFENLLGKDGVKSSVNKVVNERLAVIDLFSNLEGFDWVKDVAKAEVARVQTTFDRKAIDTAKAKLSDIEFQLENAVIEAKQAQLKKEELQKQHDADPSKDPADYADQLAAIDKQINDLDKKSSAAEEAAADAQTEIKHNEDNARDHEKEARKSDQDKGDHADAAFPVGE